jgi:phospholipid/cholesterol/gamma-HCH transport system substrate-binding protein
MEVLTGAAVLVVAAGFLGYAVAHSGRSISAGYPLQARFEHIDGQAVGSDVRIAGVKVATVTSEQIDPKSFQAVVSLTVRDDVQFPKDSSAEITSESLLGGKYNSLSPGGEEAIL